MLYESSFSKFCDESTVANYLSEVEDMPPSSEKSKILFFLGTREMLLRPVAEHDKNKEEGEHSGLKTECVGTSQGKDAAQQA